MTTLTITVDVQLLNFVSREFGVKIQKKYQEVPLFSEIAELPSNTV